MPKKLDPKVAEEIMLKAHLQPLVPYKDAKTNWKCQCLVCGSIVTPRYATVQTLGAGCKTCRYRKIREHHVFKIAYVKEVIEKRGGKLISQAYTNSDTPLDIKCSKEHLFTNTFNHINRGQWCPTCSKGSKSEEICRTTFEQLFNQPFPKFKPKWLLNNRGNRMEIDGYCKDLKIGFEYQGRQHFDLVLFGNSPKQRKSDDKVKAQLCREHGINLFIITYKMNYKDFPKYIARQAKKFRIDLPSNFENIEVDISKAYIRNDRINELQELLKPKEILVLSKKYLGSNQKINLQCLVCNHKWSALGSAFFNRRRVAGCDKCNRRKAGERNKLNIQQLEEYAEKYGGKLLSSQYVQSKYRYSWKCNIGHAFTGIYAEMKYRKQFCPICEGRQIRNHKNRGYRNNP
jgi:hypothetical protein